MGANFGFPTWPDQYGASIIARLVDKVPGMTQDRVFWSTYDDQLHLDFPPADRFITLFQPQFPVRPGSVSGGGKFTTEFESRLVAKAFIRVEADIEGKTAQWLNDQAFGVYSFAKQMVSGLQVWEGPTDPVTTMSLFTRPMRLMPGFEISKHNRDKNGGRWGICTSNWEVSFVSDLGTSYLGALT